MGHGTERGAPVGRPPGPAQPAGESGTVPGEDELRRLITRQLGEMCGLRDVDPDRSLEEHGLSSRDAVALAGYLETLVDRSLPPTLVWEHPTVSRLASALAHPAREEPAHPGLTAPRPPAEDAVAVVGLGCRFPGGAAGPIGDPEAFWNFLADRGDAVGQVPRERWAAFDDGSPEAGDALSSVTRWAGVMPDVAGFDAAFFGISPAEAVAMDPQQRMLLEVSWEALENAGIAPATLRGSRTGVFAGISAAEYAHLTTSDLSRIGAWTATGAATSIAAGRISYLLDLRGPSLAVDTACSSSLLAVHLAVCSLRRQESDLALAGGVNLLVSPVITMTFDAGGGTSPDGRCRPFDAGANGMVRGEGCGVVVLKRLADARRDGDRVLAVITATAVNSDGHSNGLVAPSAAAQRDLLRAAHVIPGQVDYVEAHGTGTPLGDPMEAQALGQVLGVARPATRPLLIGSVKSNIGHLEAAAGVAGLIKTVLALDRRQIPPTLNFTGASPHIPLADLGLAVANEVTDWPENLWPPTAGVSAFGFSGTNVHVALAAAGDDYPVNGHKPGGMPDARAGRRLAFADGKGAPGGEAPRSGGPGVTPRVSRVFLSDRSADRVRDQARQLAAWLERRPPGEPTLTQIARTLDRRQGRGPHRSAVIARSRAELADGLRALGAGERHPAVVSGTDGRAGPGVAFVFSGYGSQWPGMGRALAAAEPVFAEALAELEEPLREATGELSLAGALGGDDALLNQVQYAQPLLFGIQVALARLWEAHGVRPAAVIGHSMGEVAAAVVGGALSVADGARVIACRSRLLTRLAGAGAMALVGLPADEVTGLAADLPGVHLAVISSPAQCVVTGAAAQVGELATRARGRGAAARVLDAAGAGHSPQVDPLLPELTAQLADIAPRPPATRFYSTALDDPGAPHRCDAAYWAANLRRPVRLGPAVAAAAGDGLRTFVEVSPHPLVTRALEETVRHATGRAGVITGTLRRGAGEALTFHAQLATLAVGGYPLPRQRSGTIIDLPPAPWRHEPYWADPPPRPGPAGHPLLGPHVELPTDGHAWQRQIAADDLRDLRASAGLPLLFPLSAAAEMVIAAACEAWAVPATAVQVSALRLVRMLPVGAGMALTTTLDGPVPGMGGRRATVRIHARDATGAWKLVASGHAAEDDAPEAWDMPSARAGLPARAGGSGSEYIGKQGEPPAGVCRMRGPAEGWPEQGAGGLLGGEAPRTGGPGVIPRADRARGQHVPAEILDRCLAAACTDGEIPAAIGLLRVRGPAAAGGRCQVLRVRAGHGGDGAVAADLRLTAGSAADGPPLLEAFDVLVSRVPRTAIPVPYADKLLELTWQPQDLPASTAMDVPKGPSEGVHRYIHEAPARRWIVLHGWSGADGPGSAPGPGEGRDGSAARDRSAGNPAAPPVARELAAILRAAGHRVDLVPGPCADAAGGPHDDARGGKPGGGDEPLAGVVLVAPEAPVHPVAGEHVVLDAIRAAASLAARPGSPRLWIATAGAAAARPGEAGDPGLAALRGLVRVLALEQPALRATMVDLDQAADPAAAAATLAAELTAGAPDDEVAWRDGGRLVARLARAPVPREPAGRRGRRPVVRRDGGYIITGGCGGLGLVVARWLAERGASRIVLNGRSGAEPQAQLALDQMRAAGARVRVVRGDISQPGVASRLVAAARTGGTPLCGIVHAAGVFADALLDDVTPGDLSRIWAAKVAGAWRLHEATEHADLDWFVLFSSAAALLGSPGQAAYASASAGLDALAAWRRARGLPATAVNWGIWSGAGRAGDMVIRGIDPISPEEGVEALEALLAEDRSAAGVIRIDPSAAAAAYPEIAAIPFFRSLIRAGSGDNGSGAAGPPDWPGAEALRAVDPERRRALTDERARSQVAAVLGLPAGQLPADLPLADAGMDSLAAQRIANLLEHDLAVTIEPALLLGGATLAGLQESLAAALEGAPAGQGAAAGPASPSGTRRRVEPRDAAERQVARVAAEVLRTGPLGVTDDLRASHAARAEIAARLTRETGRDLDPEELFAVPTVEAAADLVRLAEDEEASGLIRQIRAGGPRLPVLLAHPAGGSTGVYKTLAGLLDDDRSIFGLERLEGPVTDRCIRYAEAILERFPGGCVVGGWSFGGVLGYETARQLAAMGRGGARLVVLLDAALPLPVPPGDEEHVLARRFAAFAEYLTRTYGRAVRLSADELRGLSEDAQRDLVTRRMGSAGLIDELSPAILRHQQTSYEDTRALERYRSGGYDGHVVLYRAERETPWAVRDPRYEISGETHGWDRLCPRLEVVGIDAHHLNLLDPPAVTAVAAHLRELLSTIGGEQ